MRLILCLRREPDAETIGLAVALVALAGGMIWRYGLGQPFPKGVLCRFPFFSCPFCGGARSLDMFLQGHLWQAIAMNPLAALLYVGTVFWLLYALVVVALRWPRLRLIDVTASQARILRGSVLVALLANWWYVW
jgi:hypothetical protein